MPISSFVQFISNIGMIQESLDRELLEKPANERLVGLVEKIRELGLKLDSDNLGHIYSALPNRLSAKVKKDDIQLVQLPKAVYDQLQAALSDERVQKYLKDYERNVPRRRLWAGDLLETLKGLGFRLSTNPISFHGALPSYLKKFVVSIKRNYHTDSDGRLIVKFHRSFYRVYNFSNLPIKNGFWVNRNVIPLWNNSGEITAFEVENQPGSTLTIQAADVIETGIPVMQVVTKYRGEEIWREVVTHDPDVSERIQFEDWSRRLEEIIRAYNGAEMPVTEYMDFLVMLSELRQAEGLDANKMLEVASAESTVPIDKATDFLRYLISSDIRNRGIDIKAILSEGMINYLQTDRAMLSKEENTANPPGGIDFNLDLLNLEIQGRGNDFNIPVKNLNFQQIHIDGLMPVIINITPITNLPLILGAAEREEKQELTSVR